MRTNRRLSVIPILLAGIVVVAIPLVLWTAHASTLEQAGVASVATKTQPAAPHEMVELVRAVPAATAAVSPPISQVKVAVLDRPRQYALGMIETGNNDGAVGGAGEVSRYQIMPSVWQQYNPARNYRDPAMSLEVAQQHWTSLYDYFRKKTGREPTDFDMYVLWNTRRGYYATHGFNPARLHSTVRDGAQRFCNLVELGMSREVGIPSDKRA